MLPPVLGNPDYITDKEHFQTTTGTTHDYKAHGGTLSNTRFKKAPGSWKVHYVEDNIAKVNHSARSHTNILKNTTSFNNVQTLKFKTYLTIAFLLLSNHN